MCGIVGYYSNNPNNESHIQDALKLLHHRGPDNSGYYSDGDLILGHVRLSILDLSESGNQPFISADGKYVIVFNGEVYNFQEIKTKLEQEGVVFKSNSDTEVVLYSLIYYGTEKALNLFNGMFSFTFYDIEKKELIIARDRLGVKPLYYYKKGKELLFASELKGIMKHSSFKKEFDQTAISQYLQFLYIPTPRTIFKDCYKLKSGYYLNYNLTTNELKEHKYWTPKKVEGITTFEQARDKAEEILKSSVKYRLVSDVPVGMFLSGGIDSSLASAFMVKESPNKINTFTIGFSEKKFNEAEKAKKIAEYLGTNHQEIYCKTSEAKDLIPKLVEYYDEPYADSSAIPTLLLSHFTSQHQKVVLSADGGDELFGGYNKYDQYYNYYNKLNQLKLVKGGLKAGFSLFSAFKKSKRTEKFKGVLKAKTPEQMFHVASSSIQYHETLKLMNNPAPYKPINNVKFNGDFRNSFMRYDMWGMMEGDILTKVDRATMAYSLEAREPMLDYRLVELSLSIPSSIKYQKGQKSILKEILYKHIPRELVDYPKQGFNVPLDDWLKNDLKYLVEELLSEDNLKKHNIFNIAAVQRYKEAFYQGKVHFYNIWTLLCFQMWYNKWMEN
jgi:asparagine synthase (glutamine-hydrolysing)